MSHLSSGVVDTARGSICDKCCKDDLGVTQILEIVDLEYTGAIDIVLNVPGTILLLNDATARQARASSPAVVTVLVEDVPVKSNPLSRF
jgi:hypothetical protein